jgi:hypothetical protein
MFWAESELGSAAVDRKLGAGGEGGLEGEERGGPGMASRSAVAEPGGAVQAIIALTLGLTVRAIDTADACVR